MTRADRFNALFVLFALGLGTLATTIGAPRRVVRRDAAHRVTGHVIDTSGTPVKVGDYRRIISGSLVGDRLLVELVEPDRVLAFSSWSVSSSAWGFQYEGRPRVDVGDVIERVLAMHPDLVLVSNFVDSGRVARLRAAGIAVFDLGPMHGVETLVRNTRDLSELLGHPERGERLARSFLTRMDAVAADVPDDARPRAIYLGIHASRIYGGTRGSSFHDVLRYAGTVDAASERYFGWPTLTSEQILELDPDVVVTQAGKGTQVCRHAGLERLRACTRPRGIVEIDDAILNDPSFAMLDAAEALRLAVHGPHARKPAP